jgi:hypothetical protein
MRFEGVRRGYNETVRRGEAVALSWPQMASGATGGAGEAEGEQCPSQTRSQRRSRCDMTDGKASHTLA